MACWILRNEGSFGDHRKLAWDDQTWTTMWRGVVDSRSESTTPWGCLTRHGTGSIMMLLVEGKSLSGVFPMPLVASSAATSIAKPNRGRSFANLMMYVQCLLYFEGPNVSYFPPSKAQQRLQLYAVECAERWFEAVFTIPAAADCVHFVRRGEGGGTLPSLLCWLWTWMQVCQVSFGFPWLLSCVR